MSRRNYWPRADPDLLTPSCAELAYARGVIAKLEAMEQDGEGSGVDGGQFIDPVVITPARKTIARAEAPL